MEAFVDRLAQDAVRRDDNRYILVPTSPQVLWRMRSRYAGRQLPCELLYWMHRMAFCYNRDIASMRGMLRLLHCQVDCSGRP